jgi:hypothetical protein
MSSFSKGFDAFDEIIQEALKNVDKAIEVIEDVVIDFVEDVRRLPKPRSEINKVNYTHLLDTITYEKKESSIETGWGKYYGPIVENLSPHLISTYERNRNKYINKMKKNLGF